MRSLRPVQRQILRHLLQHNGGFILGGARLTVCTFWLAEPVVQTRQDVLDRLLEQDLVRPVAGAGADFYEANRTHPLVQRLLDY